MAQKNICLEFILLLACSLICESAPVPSPVVIYSGFTDIQVSELDVYHLDLSCFSGTPGTFLMNVDQPDFTESVTGAYMYVSNGPTKGQNSPYPDPSDNTTFQWSTVNGTGSPLAGISLSNAGGMDLYVTIDCPNGELCSYTLVTEFDPTTSKSSQERVRPNKPSYVEYSGARNLSNLIQKPIFFSNRIETNGLVNYNNYVQNQVLLCQSALVTMFGKNTNICLTFTIVGDGPDFIFYQQVSLNPSAGQKVPKWQTRPPNPNPYLDFSGKSKLPVNRWVSLPTTVSQIPSFVYHTIYGLGGKGLEPPYPNPFIAYYEISNVCPS